ncbi:MAG: N-acetylmuramic acid 6-phosphate etherase [Planctomycetota bacterium]
MSDIPSPSDRGHLPTERRPSDSTQLDPLDTSRLVRGLINAQRPALDAVAEASPQLAALVDDTIASIRRGGRLIYLGAGTSGRLGVLDASECPPTFGLPHGVVVGLIAGGDAALRKSSEAKEDHPEAFTDELNKLGVAERDVVIGITAGGTTPCVHGGLALAAGRGAVTGIVACAPVEPWRARHVVVLNTGPEPITGSTRLKAGTATKLALNTLTTAVMVGLGKTYGDLMVDLRATNEKLRDRAIRIIREVCEVDRSGAAELLERADGQAKLAITMARLGLDRETAERRLAAVDGRLAEVLGPPPRPSR